MVPLAPRAQFPNRRQGSSRVLGGPWEVDSSRAARYPNLPIMRSFNVVVERDPDTGLYVGHVPGWPGAHSQGKSLDELQEHLKEVVAMLLEDGDPRLESEFVGVQTIKVA